METDKLYDYLVKCGLKNIQEGQGNFRACCPYHGERNPSWGISTTEPHPFGCFACRAKGVLYHLLVQVGGYSPKKAKRICLIYESELRLPEFSVHEEKIEDDLIDRTLLYPFTLQKKARQYLEKRGISPATAKRARIVYDQISDAILFPWYFEKSLKAVTARPFEATAGVKTLPIWGSLKKSNLYVPSRKIEKGRLVVVEGEIDALSVYELSQQVAGIGRGTLSKEQAKLIVESACDDVCIFTDDDDTGAQLASDLQDAIGFTKTLSRVNYASLRGHYKGKKLDPAALSEKHRILVLKSARKHFNFSTF
jgi:DNA primase